MSTLYGNVQFLAPEDAVANRWGRKKSYGFRIDPPPYIEDADHETLNSESLMEASDETDESIASVPPSPLFDTDSIQYADNYQRSSSALSLYSVLTTNASPTPSKTSSKRISWAEPARPKTQDPILKSLSRPILTRIIRHLRNIHESPRSATCSACFNHDAFNLALVNRAWDHAVRDELYRIIHIDGPDQPLRGRNAKPITRIKLLHHTLQSRPALARKVQELRIWNSQAALSEAVVQQVASTVLLCPNLKVFNGSQPFYNHEASSLHQALATRTQLESHLWIISSTPRSSYHHEDFIRLHGQWENMTMLALRCQRGATLDRKCFNSLTQSLPALEKLTISGFGAENFDDACLLALKPLKALRLADLSGISDQGLLRFINSPQAQNLVSLSLVGLNMASLHTIARLLAKLPLEKFVLTQYRSLDLPASDVVIQPLLASSTLRHLHWDIPLEKVTSSTATAYLISSIQYNGFPSLHTLRCPSDTTNGDLQALCQPQPSIRYSSSLLSTQISGTTLRAARLRAQARTTEAWLGKHQLGTIVKIIVTDPGGIVQQDIQAGWLGYVGCDRKIHYSLISDVSSLEQRRCLAEEGDMLGDVLDGIGAGCRGTAARRRHIERQRWTGGDLDRLF